MVQAIHSDEIPRWMRALCMATSFTFAYPSSAAGFNAAITTSYGYDNAGRLTSESKSNGYAAD